MPLFASPIASGKWTIPVPNGLQDVQERSPLSVADATFAALGFQRMPDVSLGEPQVCWAWVHPAGMIAAATGSVLGGGDPKINSFRLGAVVNEGLFPMSPIIGGKDYRSSSWQDVTGECFRAFNVSLDPSIVGPAGTRLTLLRTIAGMQKMGKLEGFERWASESRHDTTRSWLFVVGDDTLEAIDSSVGIDGWLRGAPSGLIEAIETRALRRAQGTVPTRSPESMVRSRQRQGLERLTALARATSRRYPRPEALAQARAWFEGSVWIDAQRSPSNAALDFAVRTDGWSQAGALVSALQEPGAGALLVQWLRQAPEKTLAKVAIAPDPIQQTLVGRLIAALVEQPPAPSSLAALPPESPTRWVLDALEVVMERLGAHSVQHALALGGGAIGILVRCMTNQSGMTLDAVEGTAALLPWLESQGVVGDWRSAPLNAPPLNEEDPGGRGPGESWSQALDRVLGYRGGLREMLAPVNAYVRQQELLLALPEAPVSVRKGPRF